MTPRSAIALARAALAASVAFAIGSEPPDPAKLYASLATAVREPFGLGWLGARITSSLIASPLPAGALAAFACACALAAFALVERRAAREASPAVALGAVALAAICSLDALRAGGATATLAFVAALAFALESPSLRGAFAVGALSLAWCNLEAAGLLAPAFAFASALGRTLEDRRARATANAWIGAALAGLAAFATPLGAAFPARAFASLGLDGTLGDIAPWTPSALAPHAYRGGVLILIAAALALSLRAGGVRGALLGAFAFVVALANGAFVPVVGIVAAPVVALAFARRFPAFANAVPRAGALPWATVAGAAGLALAAGIAATRFPAAVAATPYTAVAHLVRSGAAHRVFCARVAWCDAATAAGLSVVADSRVTSAPERDRATQVEIAHVRKAWRADVARLHVDAIVAANDSPLATLVAERHWTRLADAGGVTIFVPERAAR